MGKGRGLAQGISMCLAAMLAAQAPDIHAEQRLNFVTCPIVRDTSTVPCWLVRYQGELYYLGIQTDVSAEFRPPWLGHQVLVEAVVSDRPRICGGIVLDPVHTTPMPELDPSCNTILPAEAQYTIDFNPRPPGPSGGRLAYAGQKTPREELPVAQQNPWFELTFDFDRSIAFNHPRELMRIVEYARQVSARRISVHGNRGAMLLSDGTVLVEHADTARRRARDVARLLGGVGLSAEITAEWSDEPLPADGTDDWRSRSVKVLVEP
jgi:hypothetical protein